jgi:hypothetical protein
MAYDEDLADRLREATQHEDGVIEKRMFGGLAFLINGNLAVSASGKGDLMLRVDPANSDQFVDGVGIDADLERWVEVGVGYARSLPAK